MHAQRTYQHSSAHGCKGRGRTAVLFFFIGVCVQHREAEIRKRRAAEGDRCVSGHARGATAGKSCSASACAVTSWRTSDSKHAWLVTTMSMVLTGPLMEGARKLRRRSAGKSYQQN